MLPLILFGVGLERGVEYMIRVHALTVNGSGPASPWVSAETFLHDLDGECSSSNAKNSVANHYVYARLRRRRFEEGCAEKVISHCVLVIKIWNLGQNTIILFIFITYV